MLRTVVLLAGLGAALIIGGLPAVRSEAVPDSNQTAWVEQHVQDVTGGQSYRLDGCVTVTAPGLTSVSLRLEWYTEPDGFGTAFYNNNARADSQLVGPQQCLSLTATAPCPARSVRHGVLASPDPGAVEVSGLEFSMESGASPVPCATATPTPTPTPTTPAPEPEPTATPAPEPTAAPTPTPTPLSPAAEPAVSAATEPTLFPTLVNGGFEDLRQDGTPYGWRKVGGMTSTSSAVHTEGDRSAILISTTESTKWLYQTLEVEGGSYYRLRANALKSDPEAREALLRISWYESADGSGNQLSTSESPALTGQSLRFATLDTGPVQAPPEAQSAKVRLLLRPASAASTAVYFDDVRFGETAAPANEDPLNGERDPEVATEGGSSEVSGNAPQAAPAEAAALSAWAGPTPLANVRKAPEQQPDPATGGGRPLWPLLLALAVPAVGLTVMAGHAWWRARLAGGNERHL